MTMFEQAWEIVGRKADEENPGHQLVLNSEHLAAIDQESPGPKHHRPEVMLTVFGYPVVVDESATTMRLESA